MRLAKLGVFLAFAAALSTGSAFAEETTYHVALDGTFAPHAMPTMDGGVQGFNVDLANAIGKELGAKMDITAAQFSGLIPGMQAGTYDFLVAPVTVSKERAENLLFTEPYLDTDFQFVVKKGTPDVKSLDEFKGKVIAVNKGSNYDEWARGLADKIGWKVESYGTNTDALQAVLSGRAFANVAGNTVSAWAVKKQPSLQLSYLYKTGNYFSMPFRKGDVKLRDKVENAIECLKQKGVISDLAVKWFGVKPTADDAAVTIYPGYGIPNMPGYEDLKHTPSCS